MVTVKIAAGEFKSKCLKLMDQVKETNTEIVITKFGKPVAKLMPIKKDQTSAYGKLKDTMKITGDIVAPIDENWNASNNLI